MLLLPLVELASVGVHRTRARRATAVSSLSRRARTRFLTYLASASSLSSSRARIC